MVSHRHGAVDIVWSQHFILDGEHISLGLWTLPGTRDANIISAHTFYINNYSRIKFNSTLTINSIIFTIHSKQFLKVYYLQIPSRNNTFDQTTG